MKEKGKGAEEKDQSCFHNVNNLKINEWIVNGGMGESDYNNLKMEIDKRI